MSDIDSQDGAALSEEAAGAIVDETGVPPEHDLCTPLPEDATKKSKKRLREVSLEASTPKDNNDDASTAETKETHAPPKKNRLRSVEPTVPEETLRPPPTTPPPTGGPPLSTSPPHDSKVRQIRRRVKDLSWQEAQRKKPDEGSTGDVDQQDDGPEAGGATSDGKPDDDESSKSVSAKSDSDKEEVERAGGEGPATIEIVADLSAEASVVSPSDVQPMDVHPTASTESKVDPQAPIQTDEESATTNVACPSISPVLPAADACQGKRRRDDGDQNPRETKRVSPPPDQEKEEAKPLSVKPTGFMAYASSASPFNTSKNAPNIFGSSTSTPTFGSSSIPKPPASSPFTSATAFNNQIPFNNQTPASSVKFGSSGFDSYASASPFVTANAPGASPFGSSSIPISKSPSRVARSKSPGRHANAFGPYTTRSGKFSAAPSRPVKKLKRGSSVNGLDVSDVGAGSESASGSGDEAGDEEPGSPTTFGDILSAKENKPDLIDEEKKVEYTEQEVTTGEEDERTEYQVRAKLFAMAPPPLGGWKERGVGTLKLNVNKKTGRDARLVLRTDGVLRLVLNTNLFKGMNFEIAQDPRYVKFGLIQDRKVVLHTLRLASVKHAEDLLEQVKARTPGISLPHEEV